MKHNNWTYAMPHIYKKLLTPIILILFLSPIHYTFPKYSLQKKKLDNIKKEYLKSFGHLHKNITVNKAVKHKRLRRRKSKFINHENNFSKCLSIILPNSTRKIQKHPELQIHHNKTNSFIIWQKTSTKPFSELILSWNALRPKRGHFSFWINVRHNYWSGWRKLAEWGKDFQRTFCNTRKKLVHTKHVRTEIKQKRIGFEYKIKVIAENGANIKKVKALFANVSNWNNFYNQKPLKPLETTIVFGIPKQSQWWIHHSRKKDLCSPTSTSMITRYFSLKKQIPIGIGLNRQTKTFAAKVHDSSLDIFGNWLFNVAEAFNTTKGKIFYRVERLNNFEELHSYLIQKKPIAVSIRGKLRGGAWPYKNGHFVVVIGWNQKKQQVICIDPAFKLKQKLIRSYPISDFMTAWGKSRNLSYVPMTK